MTKAGALLGAAWSSKTGSELAARAHLLNWAVMTKPSLVGSDVGHIRLEAMLGTGGMVGVYLGYDAGLDRRAAVKTTCAEQRFEPEMKSRFLREARILSKLEHPAICQVYDLVEGERADPYFRICRGQDSQGADRRDGGLETRQALKIAEFIQNRAR